MGNQDSTNTKQYNWVYKELVSNPNDVVGAIAYMLYKEQKIELIQSIESENGTSPTNEQLAEFHRSSSLNSSLDAYRLKASQLISEFLTVSLDGEIQRLQDEANTRSLDEITKITSSLNSNINSIKTELDAKKSWKRTLGDAVINVLSTAVVIALVGFLIYGYNKVSELNNSVQKEASNTISNGKGS